MSSSGKRHDQGAARFGWLLRQRQIDFVPEDNLEEKIQVLNNKRPDFYAWTARVSFLAEVESFEKPGPIDGCERTVSLSPDAMTNRLRKAVQHAAAQLRPYECLGIPLLTVLDNHRRVGVDTDVEFLVQLLGTLQIVVSPRQGEDLLFQHAGGRTLNDDRKRYISAVAVNVPKSDFAGVEPVEQERPMRLRILYNPYAACQFPRDLFTDAEDEHVYLNENGWICARAE
jgi:hypothetical protein